MAISISDATKKYGEKTVIKDFSYSFPTAGIVAFIGKSGCGKTTLLRLLAGLEKPTSGDVNISLPVSFSFQEYRLFSHLNALQNVTKVAFDEETEAAKTEAGKMLRCLGFTDEEMHLFPSELSGGMKQRVALARAFCAKKNVLLLDEPFKELDGELKKKVQELMKKYAKNALVIFTGHSDAMANELNAKIVYL